MPAPFVRTLLISMLLLARSAWAEPLTLPDRLVDLRSPQGERLLLESEALKAYFPISVTFVTQANQAFCGIASMVMTLNALGVPAPVSPEYQPYATFTQANIFSEKTEAILPRAVLEKQGMTLDQLGRWLVLYPLDVQVHHADGGGLDEFRKAASTYLATEGHFVIVNYLRAALDQGRGGHISPLAAYDAESDRFLILDVARYKYPPAWVTTADLFNAMNTTDAENGDKTRGYVLISGGPGAVKTAPGQ